MPYTHISSKGKIMTFYVKAVAELYQSIYGGVIITKDVVNSTESACL
jgi:hypothetical protein